MIFKSKQLKNISLNNKFILDMPELRGIFGQREKGRSWGRLGCYRRVLEEWDEMRMACVGLFSAESSHFFPVGHSPHIAHIHSPLLTLTRFP